MVSFCALLKFKQSSSVHVFYVENVVFSHGLAVGHTASFLILCFFFAQINLNCINCNCGSAAFENSFLVCTTYDKEFRTLHLPCDIDLSAPVANYKPNRLRRYPSDPVNDFSGAIKVHYSLIRQRGKQAWRNVSAAYMKCLKTHHRWTTAAMPCTLARKAAAWEWWG